MKVEFSRAVPYIPEWNGNRDLPKSEQFSTILKPLEMEDLMQVVDAISKARSKLGDLSDIQGAMTEDTSTIKSMVSEVGHLIPKYVEVNDLQDQTGEVTVQDIVKFPFYFGLSGELVAQLSEISMPNEEEVKN
jgi:hypothetical protein